MRDRVDLDHEPTWSSVRRHHPLPRDRYLQSSRANNTSETSFCTPWISFYVSENVDARAKRGLPIHILGGRDGPVSHRHARPKASIAKTNETNSTVQPESIPNPTHMGFDTEVSE